MSEDWKIKTGTIYFHIKELKQVLDQNQDKQYILNELGKQVCQWFIGSKEGKVTVAKIDSYAIFGNRLSRSIQSPYFHMLMLLIYLNSLFISHQLSLVLLGPFLLPNTILAGIPILLANILAILGQLAIYIGIIVLTGPLKRDDTILLPGIVLLGNSLAYVLLDLLWAIDHVIPIHLTMITWGIIAVISQLFMVLVISSIQITKFGMKAEKSLLLSILMLYVLLFIGFLVSR